MAIVNRQCNLQRNRIEAVTRPGLLTENAGQALRTGNRIGREGALAEGMDTIGSRAAVIRAALSPVPSGET